MVDQMQDNTYCLQCLLCWNFIYFHQLKTMGWGGSCEIINTALYDGQHVQCNLENDNVPSNLHCKFTPFATRQTPKSCDEPTAIYPLIGSTRFFLGLHIATPAYT